MDPQITVLQPSPDQEKARKRMDDFFITCNKIRIAWDRMGYTGDQIINLFSSIQGMSVFGP